MSSTPVTRQEVRCSRYLLVVIAVGIVIIVVGFWLVPNLIQSAASTTSIADNVHTLQVNSAGVCGEWHVKSSPSAGFLKDKVNITSIDALSGNDIWMVGEVYGPRDLDDKQSRDFLALHLDKSTSQAHTLEAKLGYSFTSVKMLSSNDVWASGPDTTPGGAPQLYHWDGSHWNIVAIELPASATTLVSTSSTFFDFTALTADDFWIGGTIYPSQNSNEKKQNLMLHKEGPAFRQVQIPHVSGIGKLHAISADDVWVDGINAMLHWNGKEWRQVPRPDADGRIRDIAASSSDDVWAVGDEIGVHEGESNIVIMHWDGQAWSRVPTPKIPVPANFLSAFRMELRGVTAIAEDDAWAVGYLLGDTTDFYKQQTITLHWDGRTWNLMPSPNFSVSQSFSDIVAVSPNELWAAGQVGPDIGEKSILVAQFLRLPCKGAVVSLPRQ